ncbi:MAG: cysteine desulfurase [Nitrospirales bacterium]|nr:cysteine desulfurase [Nitrospirales bacterium]
MTNVLYFRQKAVPPEHSVTKLIVIQGAIVGTEVFVKKVYLDYAATTPVDPEVLKAMTPYFTECFGNPSSLHSFGKKAKAALEKSRETAAAFIGASGNEIVFTSGGTESNNAAIKGVAYANLSRGNHIITTAIEHRSVLDPCEFLAGQGFTVTVLPVDETGLVSPDDVRKAMTKRTILLSVMHGNNEIGTIEPIKEIGMIARSAGVCFHVDAVQTFGQIPLQVNDLGIDLLSASGHKFYGPKGVGLLYIRGGTKLTSFMHGGQQERGKRASTHNVPGIVGLAKAVEIAGERMEADSEKIRRLRERLIEGVSARVRHASLNGQREARLPGNVNFSFKNAEGELLMRHLDAKGLACSTASACASESGGGSHVLEAIGALSHKTGGAVRFSLGRHTTEEDIAYLLDQLPEVVREVRRLAFSG